METYKCVHCHYTTDKTSRWSAHIKTKKHKNNLDNSVNDSASTNQINDSENIHSLETQVNSDLEDKITQQNNNIVQLEENEKNLKHNLISERKKYENLEKKYSALKDKLDKITNNMPDSEPVIDKKDDVFKLKLVTTPKLNLHNDEIERIRKSITKMSKKGKYLNLELDEIPKAEPPSTEVINKEAENINKQPDVNIQEINAEKYVIFDPFVNCNSDSDDDSDYDVDRL